MIFKNPELIDLNVRPAIASDEDSYASDIAEVSALEHIEDKEYGLFKDKWEKLQTINWLYH